MKLEPLRVCCEMFRRKKKFKKIKNIFIYYIEVHNPNTVDTFDASANCSNNYFKFTYQDTSDNKKIFIIKLPIIIIMVITNPVCTN